jgi:transcriptional regulator with XRE-family HTH domain
VPQESTLEFSYRLLQAIEAHPLAPPTPHGRQSWLLRKLQTETGLSVSPNTIHKWVHGTARPRGDNARRLAKVLSVDEVWLSMGRKPEVTKSTLGDVAPNAQGAALLMAGLIEISGGRVSFAGPGETAHLHVNFGGGNIDVIALVPQSDNEKVTFVVPEPTREARVFGVLLDKSPRGATASASVDFVELTNLPRQNLGGFSIVQLERGEKRAFTAKGHVGPVSPLESLRAIEAVV